MMTTVKCMCVCVCVGIILSYSFSTASEANNSALCTGFDELLEWCDCEIYEITKFINVSDFLCFEQYPSSPRRGALLSSCCTESRQIEMSLVLAPTICPPTFHTIKRLCKWACVCLCVRERACVCMCLIKLRLATLIAADASESITVPPSQTPLHLHSLGLVWRISQVGEYIFRVSLL